MTAQGTRRHVLLIGINFQMRRCSGDKNFWFQLIPLLAGKLDRITVISIRKNDIPVEKKKIGGCDVVVHYMPPIFLETPDAEYDRRKFFWRGGAFPNWMGVVEKAMNVRLMGKMKELHAEEPFSHVHLMDNFGLLNRSIAKTAKRLNSTTSISAVGYQGKKSILYHPYLKLSFNCPNLLVVPYAEGLAVKLAEIGLNPRNMAHIPWGVVPGNGRVDPRAKDDTKRELALPPEKALFLWAGYIQQIKRDDFLYALENARRALGQGLDAAFFFAFKPESIEKGFDGYYDPAGGIFVASTTVREFAALKAAADVFYSPVTNADCIITPPLTWIEMLALGTPIVTTDVPGAGAVVEEGRTGYIAGDGRDLVEKMIMAGKTYPEMRMECMRKVENDYDLRRISERYLALWFKPETGADYDL